MILRKYYIENAQYRFLKALGGNESNHVRLALDAYIQKMKKLKFDVSTSVSKMLKKGGENNE